MPKEYLTTVDTARQRVRRTRSQDEVPTTEAVGDPDEDSPEAADDDEPRRRDQARKDDQLEGWEERP